MRVTQSETVLPARLSDTVAGDITLYAPRGNLAIFVKEFQSSSGLVPLGKFDSPLDGCLKDGSARIERAE
ncbi:cyclophilin-like fold protein [Acidimangrovimonas sediminis]|uniref:cyclophilin-like fold protein n=1 Tax=Acidimangrovimonas sediminis TaxID=2056283 RepID=UPI000C80AD2D|nr:cyclophilin-like fold protein [Acidimangrovimonas sediminis]